MKYGAFATTHYCLAYLAELGMDRTNPSVAKAAERYLTFQKAERRLLPALLLSRDGIFKKTNLKAFVNRDMEWTSFPITWRANVFEILLALSRMGFGNVDRLERAWQVLDAKRDGKGRYLLDWTPRQSPWKVGKRKEPNKWVTFYASLAHKFREEITTRKNS